MTNSSDVTRVERQARLRWISIPKMKVSPLAQRELKPQRVNKMAADFDPEQIGSPTVNERDGSFYIIDGQHRVETLKAVGWGDQSIQCWTYVGLSEEDEAEMFLKLNNTLSVNAFSLFRIGITAGRDTECDIDRIVRAQGLRVSRELVPGAVRGVGTLRRIYTRSDGPTLGRALRIVRDAYGDAGMEATVIDGIGLLCQRYNGQLEDPAAVKKLSSAHGGVSGLLNKADVLRRSTGRQKNHCVAAAAIDIINSGRNGRKLPSWWKSDNGQT